ncbi:glycerophosphodiester phosphodiesterase [candidate division WOR-3 bacterium]|nr:glycerophosphodiester phosphodiesterase [candidate division WOR-3 bacterium]
MNNADALTRGFLFILACTGAGYGFIERTGTPLILAHRAGALIVPENTAEGWSEAKRICNPDVFELDVWLTADDSLVVFHDETVDRTTDRRGMITELTFEELEKLDAGYRFSADGGKTYPWRGKGVKIPALAELLDSFPADNFNIEIKDTSSLAAEKLAALIDVKGAADRVMVGSENQSSLDEFRSLAPDIPTSGAARELKRFVIFGKIGLAFLVKTRMQALQIPEYYGSIHVLTKGLIRRCHRRDIQVHVWTVNDPGDMRRLLEMGVDGIITDRPDAADSLMREMGSR